MIGWNKVKTQNKSQIFKEINQNSFFYFTHSFYADPKEKRSFHQLATIWDLNIVLAYLKEKFLLHNFTLRKVVKLV